MEHTNHKFPAEPATGVPSVKSTVPHSIQPLLHCLFSYHNFGFAFCILTSNLQSSVHEGVLYEEGMPPNLFGESLFIPSVHSLLAWEVSTVIWCNLPVLFCGETVFYALRVCTVVLHYIGLTFYHRGEV